MDQTGSDEQNPYAPPLTDISPQGFAMSEENALFAFSATGGDRFRFVGFEDRLELRNKKTGKVIELLRREPLFVKLVDWLFVQKTFRRKTDQKFASQLDPQDFETLREWIGPPKYEDLKEAVGGSSWWQLVVAGIFLLPTLIFGLNAIPPDLAEYIIPIMLIIGWIAARIRPHRWLFLLLAAVFGTFFAQAILDDLQFGIGDIAAGLFGLNMMAWYVHQFRAYANIEFVSLK